jgi:hypothetical protein
MGFGETDQADDVTVEGARERDQDEHVITYYRSFGISGNIDNGISPRNSEIGLYQLAALAEFGLLP